MARYVFRDGIFVDRQTGVPMDKPFAGQIVAPNVMSDIPEYRSPVDGKVIGSRSERRDDLNHVIDVFTNVGGSNNYGPNLVCGYLEMA